ncbi:MAG: hypothetical protein WDN31_23175 [Hyphomicrobium sp.]
MGMKTLISAAHAAGYAMAGEDVCEQRAEVVARVPQSTAVVIHRPHHRGMIATAHRSLRRMWLKAWAADHWNHRAAA